MLVPQQVNNFTLLHSDTNAVYVFQHLFAPLSDFAFISATGGKEGGAKGNEDEHRQTINTGVAGLKIHGNSRKIEKKD